MPGAQISYRRILLKMSGESLAASRETGINRERLTYFASEIKKAHDLGCQIAIVIGGGNIFRGLSDSAREMDRVTADYMGMLATMINALALQDALISQGLQALAMSAVDMPKFARSFDRQAAIELMQDKRVIILGAGTGNPFFTTDTAAVLRAVELHCDILLKGTRVDGVYSADPEKVADAVKFGQLTYMETVQRNLQVMDLTAITMAMDNHLPIIVFDFNQENNLERILKGHKTGTLIQG